MKKQDDDEKLVIKVINAKEGGPFHARTLAHQVLVQQATTNNKIALVDGLLR